MARYNNTRPRLLTPPTEREEVYPYRRVWPSLAAIVLILFGVAAALYFVPGFLGIGVPTALIEPVNVGLALLPAALWLALSRFRERFAIEPRQRLTSVFVTSLLVSNAVGVPLLNYLNVGEWLSTADTVNRWIGYTVTVGVSHEVLKYLILRFLVWPDYLRIRFDAIAYSVACSVGYVTVLHLQYIGEGGIPSDVAVGRIFTLTVVHICAGVIVAYGLADVRFNPRSLFILPFTLIVGAAVHGLAIPTRAGLVNAGFVLGIAGNRPLFGLIFSLILAVGLLVTMGFLFNVAERRAQLAAAQDQL